MLPVEAASVQELLKSSAGSSICLPSVLHNSSAWGSGPLCWTSRPEEPVRLLLRDVRIASLVTKAAAQ